MSCSVRAKWLFIGWPFWLAEMRREFRTGEKNFLHNAVQFFLSLSSPLTNLNPTMVTVKSACSVRVSSWASISSIPLVMVSEYDSNSFDSGSLSFSSHSPMILNLPLISVLENFSTGSSPISFPSAFSFSASLAAITLSGR